MRARVYSLETEYALVDRSTAGHGRAADALYEALEALLLVHHEHAPCDPTRKQRPDRESAIVAVCEGYFLANGARIYCDNGHFEWSAPETVNPYQAVVYDRAAERCLAQAARTAAGKPGSGRIMAIKNNVDYRSGVTYGCHENYSIYRRTTHGHNAMAEIRERLVPFLVTRQLLCGAGRVGADCPPYVGFQLSQRADFTTSLSSVKTRENRPILNERDEPLADSRTYARLHLILGDSNMAEFANFLKLGTTGLLLDLVEAGALLPALSLARPIEAIQAVSRDLEMTRPLPLAGGGSETALGVQRSYWQAARTYFATDPSPQAQEIIDIWGGVLASLERRSSEVAQCLDWAIKHRVLQERLSIYGVSWDEYMAWGGVLGHTRHLETPQSTPAQGWAWWLQQHLSPGDWQAVDASRRQHGLDLQRYGRFRRIASDLQMIDILYHDIDLESGLFHRLQHIGQVAGLIDGTTEIEAASRLAPNNSRAAVRARALQLAREHQTSVVMDWDRLHFPQLDREVSLPDPLSSDMSGLAGVFAHVRPAQQPAHRLAGWSAGKVDADLVVELEPEIDIEILSVEDI